MSADDTAGDQPQGGSQSGGPTEPPGGPKRPTPTIELKAEEVEVSKPEAETQAEEAGAEEDHAQEAAEEPRAAERVRAFTAPQSTRPRELRGFFTHLAAGLLGGLIGVLAVGYGLDRLPISDLLQRLQGEPPADAAKLADIESRLSQVQATAEQARKQAEGVDIGAVQDRIANLEATLKSLSDSAKEGGGGELAQAAALSGRITELGDKLGSQIAGLKTQIGTLQTSAARTNAVTGEVKQLRTEMQSLRDQVAASANAPELSAQLDAFGQRLGRLEQDVRQAGAAAKAGGSQARLAAYALAYANLERGVYAGRPFAGELEAVETLAPSGTDLSGLKARAGKGVPTLAELQASFRTQASAAAKAEQKVARDTWLDKLLDSAESVVTIRRTAPDAGTGTQAILARMGERVSQGDIAGAVQQGETLQGPPRQAMQPWLDEAKARLAAIARLQALHTELISSLGASAPAGQ